MAEKLALKTELNKQLFRLTKEIEELEKSGEVVREFDYETKMCLLKRNRDDVLKLIAICVDRNKF